jgi:hypothetical protein
MAIFIKSISMVHLVPLPSNAPPSLFRWFLVAFRIKVVNGNLETFISWDGSVLNIIHAFNLCSRELCSGSCKLYLIFCGLTRTWKCLY